MNTQTSTDITNNNLNHPGVNDPVYRKRRDEIARLAKIFPHVRLPRLHYTPEEHATWKIVREQLDPLHHRQAAAFVRERHSQLRLSRETIPQLY